MSTSAPTHVVEVNGSALRTYVLSPADAGLATSSPEDVRGGTPADNAATTRAILDGEPGPRRDIAVLNAGAAIYAAGRAESVARRRAGRGAGRRLGGRADHARRLRGAQREAAPAA